MRTIVRSPEIDLNYAFPSLQNPAARIDLRAELYRQLRVLTHYRLRDGGRNTLLDTTSLVHEAYLSLGNACATSDQRRQLLAYTSKAIRSVVIDNARRWQSQRRAGEVCIVTLIERQVERVPAATDRGPNDALVDFLSSDSDVDAAPLLMPNR